MSATEDSIELTRNVKEREEVRVRPRRSYFRGDPGQRPEPLHRSQGLQDLDQEDDRLRGGREERHHPRGPRLG